MDATQLSFCYHDRHNILDIEKKFSTTDCNAGCKISNNINISPYATNNDENTQIQINERGRELKSRLLKKKASVIMTEKINEKSSKPRKNIKTRKERASSFSAVLSSSKISHQKLIRTKLAEKLYSSEREENFVWKNEDSKEFLVFSQETEFLHFLEGQTGFLSVENNQSLSNEQISTERSENSHEIDNYLGEYFNTHSRYFSSQEVKELTCEIEIARNSNFEKPPSRSEDIFYEKSLGHGIAAVLEIVRNQRVLYSVSSACAEEDHDRKVSRKSQTEFKNITDIVQNDTDRISQYVEVALRRIDNYGRLLTVKEAFRELCYRFHGKGPSKNRQQKRVNRYVQELITKKRLTSELVTRQTNKILQIQRKLSLPYILVDRNSIIEGSNHFIQNK